MIIRIDIPAVREGGGQEKFSDRNMTERNDISFQVGINQRSTKVEYVLIFVQSLRVVEGVIGIDHGRRRKMR